MSKNKIMKENSLERVTVRTNSEYPNIVPMKQMMIQITWVPANYINNLV